MTLTCALEHPWLKSHVPVYGPTGTYTTNNITNDYSMDSVDPVIEGSFRGSVNNDFYNMRIEPASSAHGTFIGGLATNGSNSQPSRGVPLQRGSLAVLQAMEDGTLSDPPVEMIANAAAQHLREQQENIIPKGTNKRVHSELTPLPEEKPDDVTDGASSSAAVDDEFLEVPNSNEEVTTKPTPAPKRKGRGKGKPASNSSPSKSFARLATTDAVTEASTKTPTRRSTRLQKVARRT